MSVRSGVHCKIDAGLLRKLPVVARFRINEQLPLIVFAGRVKKEIAVSRKEYTAGYVGTIESFFAPSTSPERQIRFLGYLQLLRTILLVDDEFNFLFSITVR